MSNKTIEKIGAYLDGHSLQRIGLMIPLIVDKKVPKGKPVLAELPESPSVSLHPDDYDQLRVATRGWERRAKPGEPRLPVPPDAPEAIAPTPRIRQRIKEPGSWTKASIEAIWERLNLLEEKIWKGKVFEGKEEPDPLAALWARMDALEREFRVTIHEQTSNINELQATNAKTEAVKAKPKTKPKTKTVK